MNSCTFEYDVCAILKLFEELLCEQNVRYDEVTKLLHAEYCTWSYDLIDKDLDYDEAHHAHLLSNLEVSIDDVCKGLIERDDCTEINVMCKDMPMRGRIRDVKKYSYGKSNAYFMSSVTCYKERA